MIRDVAVRHATLLYRSGSLLAYGAVALILPYVGSIALAAYNKACEIGDRFVDGRFFMADQSVVDLGTCIIIAMPILFARSNPVIKANAVFSFLTLLWAIGLISTASTPPYECVTMGGDYEDNASGLGEFGLFFPLLLVVSYIVVVVDLLCWALRRLTHAFKR